ncbi:RNA polymerase sigma factor [Streptomyces sp. LN785]|uniref:RNA polymerase sigma factor n=1 Tax=Streptomyces sp. LN785 TaxID=3112983 RepID=UPI00372206FE
MTGHPAVEDLLRTLAPQVLGILVRRLGDFDMCEDAVQEALIAAARHWPAEGVPANPRGWLLQAATRRYTDQVRSEQARQRREERTAREPAAGSAPADDDTLMLLFMCCHPTLTVSSAIALTLRAVGGLATSEIAGAYLVPEATMAQRISRAKQRLKASDHAFDVPQPGTDSWAPRLRSVLHVLYLMFNEGYTTTRGSALHRADLSGEAIRLAGQLHHAVPREGEATALLALMLLTEARRPARTGPDGELIPLTEQDRTRWDRRLIGEGAGLLASTIGSGPPGEYRLQAAIAAVHDDAARAEDTDWPQILGLYGLLERVAGSPVVTLNRAVAVAMVSGPTAALTLLDKLDADNGPLHDHHRVHAVRAHLLEMAGDTASALVHYRAAAARTTNTPEQRFLTAKAARLHRRTRLDTTPAPSPAVATIRDAGGRPAGPAPSHDR